MKSVAIFRGQAMVPAVEWNRESSLRLFDAVGKFRHMAITPEAAEELRKLHIAVDSGAPTHFQLSKPIVMSMMNVASELMTQRTSLLRMVHAQYGVIRHSDDALDDHQLLRKLREAFYNMPQAIIDDLCRTLGLNGITYAFNADNLLREYALETLVETVVDCYDQTPLELVFAAPSEVLQPADPDDFEFIEDDLSELDATQVVSLGAYLGVAREGMGMDEVVLALCELEREVVLAAGKTLGFLDAGPEFLDDLDDEDDFIEDEAEKALLDPANEDEPEDPNATDNDSAEVRLLNHLQAQEHEVLLEVFDRLTELYGQGIALSKDELATAILDRAIETPNLAQLVLRGMKLYSEDLPSSDTLVTHDLTMSHGRNYQDVTLLGELLAVCAYSLSHPDAEQLVLVLQE